jgi:hypothetical protein
MVKSEGFLWLYIEIYIYLKHDARHNHKEADNTDCII